MARTDYAFGKVWDETTKEWAYQVWAFVAGRSPKGTHDYLARGDAEHDPVEVPVRTITYWAKQHNWPQKQLADMRMVAPDVHASVLANIIAGSEEAGRYLRSLADGSALHDVEDSFLPNPQTGELEFSASLAKAKVERHKLRFLAAKDTLDRAGHLPHRSLKDGAVPAAPQRDATAVIAGKSSDELAAELNDLLSLSTGAITAGTVSTADVIDVPVPDVSTE